MEYSLADLDNQDHLQQIAPTRREQRPVDVICKESVNISKIIADLAILPFWQDLCSI